jgi:hypothetical protein
MTGNWVNTILGTPPAPILRKLTIAEFAWIIQRGYDYVAAETRSNKRLRPYVQGGRPKLIHPAALEIYGVDSEFGAMRFALFEQHSAA